MDELVAFLTPRLETAVISFAWLAAMFYPLEWALPARPQRRLREGLWTDVGFFFGQHLLFTAAAVAAIGWLVGQVPRGDSWNALRAAFAELPLYVQIPIVVIAGDFIVYWGHRLQHAWAPLWRIHAVHHTAERLDWLAAHREHPLDGLWTQALMNLPALAFGLPLESLMGLIAFRSLWAIFVHSNVRLPLGPLRMLLGAPELHHWHHAKDRHVGNYANLAPWIDWLFGTYHLPDHQPETFGIDEPHARSYVGLLLHPFRTSAAKWAVFGGCSTTMPPRIAACPRGAAHDEPSR